MSRPRKFICPDCNERPKAENCCYCLECNRVRNRAKRANHPIATGKPLRLYARDMCNCKNKSCDGLSCERATA